MVSYRALKAPERARWSSLDKAGSALEGAFKASEQRAEGAKGEGREGLGVSWEGR